MDPAGWARQRSWTSSPRHEVARRPVYLCGKAISHEVLTDTLGRLQSDGYGRQMVQTPRGPRMEGGFLVEPEKATFPLVCIDEAECCPLDLFEVLHGALEGDSSGRRIMLGKETIGRRTTCEPIWLVQFTLILITNFYGTLLKKAPATMSRFPIKYQFDWYRDDESMQIVKQYAAQIGATISDEAALKIAQHSNGVPRAAVQFVRRAFDFTGGLGDINLAVVTKMFSVLGYDENGLDRQQISYLKALVQVGGGRLGIDAIATILGTDRLTIETAIEPALFRRGLVVRTGAGREVTSQGRVIVLGDSAANPVYSRRVGA